MYLKFVKILYLTKNKIFKKNYNYKLIKYTIMLCIKKVLTCALITHVKKFIDEILSQKLCI